MNLQVRQLARFVRTWRWKEWFLLDGTGGPCWSSWYSGRDDVLAYAVVRE